MESWDLVAITFFSVSLPLIILYVPDTSIRTILAIPFLFFFPGYSLIAFLFIEEKSIGNVERVALSFALSIVATSLIGFGLAYTPFGLRLDPVLASMVFFNIVFCLLSLWKRSNIDAPYLPFDPFELWQSAKRSLGRQDGIDRTLTIVLALAMISSVAALAYVVAVPREGEKFTEFYILGPGGNATGYPHNLSMDQNASVIVGINNHENRQVRYIVQVWLVNASFVNNSTVIQNMFFFDQWSIVLNSTPANLDGPSIPQFQKNYTFSIHVPGHFKLWFFLFKDSVPSYAEDLDPMRDYAGGPTDRLLDGAVDNNASLLIGLNLNLVVGPMGTT